MTDPYKVLEITPEASEEEIKRAYRVLSRKYHPDANIDDPERAEEKFKEIQQAYRLIVEERERKGAYGGAFSHFSERDFAKEGSTEEYQMHLLAASNYIRNGYFREAVHVLNQMEERTAGWYYLSAVANAGIGNNVMALEHARMAVLLEPGNMQYRYLVSQLESGSNWYQGMQSSYRTGGSGVSDCCMTTCFAGTMCNLCMGGSCIYGDTYLYGPYCCLC